MVADVDGDNRVLGQVPRQCLEDGRGGQAAAPFVSGPAGFLRPPDGPALRQLGALILGIDGAQAVQQRGRGAGGLGVRIAGGWSYFSVRATTSRWISFVPS